MVDFFSHWFPCSETFPFPIRGISGWKDSSMRGALRCAITEPHVFLVLSNNNTLIPTDNSNHQLAKLHACLWIVGGSWNESAQRKGSRLDSNPGPFHCEVTLLTTVARLLLPQVFTHIYKTNTSLCDFYFPSLLCFSCRSFSQWYMFVIASTH